MGTYVELKKGDYETIKSELVKRYSIEDADFLEKILLQFGEKIGDQYVLLNNEYWEDNNSYYGVATFIDRYYGVEDSFDIFLRQMKEANANWNVYEAADELGVELPDEEDEEEAG
ncbi:hypothetical protein [Peribacillus frigoritolerans]|uniref:hypothetical protein n=1 Tax=Peribacillus frigoritolerans TaxID=450367 RepID=UPI002E1E859B|nr:hypothetical protein [Peribacillus frigoritolerans]MED3845561.1 hypothetical protein [Peribacillus frigoritolerans]